MSVGKRCHVRVYCVLGGGVFGWQLAVAYSLEYRNTEVCEGFMLKSVKSETPENDQRTFVVVALSQSAGCTSLRLWNKPRNSAIFSAVERFEGLDGDGADRVAGAESYRQSMP